MSNNRAREGGGAVFYVVDNGWGLLTFNQSTLNANPSGGFQTFPGIYENIDLRDNAPAMMHSAVN
jgi:hypothetical protein